MSTLDHSEQCLERQKLSHLGKCLLQEEPFHVHDTESAPVTRMVSIVCQCIGESPSDTKKGGGGGGGVRPWAAVP